VVEGDRSSAEKDKSKSKSGKSERKFVSVLTHQSVVQVNFGDGDGQIDTDGKSRRTSEQAEENEQAAEELGKGRKVGSPARKSQAGDELNVMVESSENLLISVTDHDSAKGQAHDEERKRLQTIKVAQVCPPAERKTDRLPQRNGGGKHSSQEGNDRVIRLGLRKTQRLRAGQTSGNVFSPRISRPVDIDGHRFAGLAGLPSEP